MNKKSSLFTSIILQLLAMALIPLVVLGIVCIVAAGSSLRDGLQEEALAQMKATCVAAKAAYDNINDGSFWYFYNDICSVFSAAVSLAALFSVLSTVFSDMAEVCQGI